MRRYWWVVGHINAVLFLVGFWVGFSERTLLLCAFTSLFALAIAPAER